ncbi:flagellar basal body-associated FliL family protein [uncultured Treponema sp.]|uniref:flagellar basal body-associated FliL family protein n=1 Tax=uncultured Treponema sp. TaxID=162155 RepID=UPI0025DEF88F|nr:flagellar basal body-associated FliL family protein [uncultured Treponema sp.]
MNKINKILLAIIGGILIFIIAVSAIALCTKNARPGEGLRHEDPLPKSVAASKTAFNEIGQIRVFTKEDENQQKSVIVLIPWFEYDGTDNSFYEELDRKHLNLKSILMNYFQNHTKHELMQLGEEKIKTELKEKVNESLVLGKITGIYFNDYLFLD